MVKSVLKNMPLPSLASICLRTLTPHPRNTGLESAKQHVPRPSYPLALLQRHQISPLLLLVFLSTSQRLSLRRDTFLSPLTCGPSLVTLDLHFLLEDTLPLLLGFGLVDLDS